MTSPSVADLDRRKARIVACLYPTRVERGFKTREDCERLGAILGVSRSAVQSWESGESLPKDEQLPVIEEWLASGPVYRYAGIGRVVGPEDWPEPLRMPRQASGISTQAGFPGGQP